MEPAGLVFAVVGTIELCVKYVQPRFTVILFNRLIRVQIWQQAL